MWDLYINDVIMNYYMEYYAAYERECYLPDLLGMQSHKHIVVGGNIGLKYILDEPILKTDTVDIFSETLIATAREICDLFYAKYKIPLTAVKTAIPGRELTVLVANRQITKVYQGSTTFRTPVEKKVQYWNMSDGMVLTDVTFKIVSPYLYFIEYLDRFNNPLLASDMDTNSVVLQKLAPLVIPQIPDKPISKINIQENKLSKFIEGRLIVYNSPLILISNLETKDEIAALEQLGCVDIKSHNIQLPGVLLMEKVTAILKLSGGEPDEFIALGGKKGNKYENRLRISIYTICYYKLVNYIVRDKFKYAAANWVLYILLIEDNTGLDLVHNGKLNFYSQIASSKYLDVENEIDVDNIYGYHVSLNDLKKKYILKLDRVYPYYTALNRKLE